MRPARFRYFACGLATVLVMLGFYRSANAQATPASQVSDETTSLAFEDRSLALTIDPCAEIRAPYLLDVLRLEMEAVHRAEVVLAEEPSEPDEEALSAQISCRGDAIVVQIQNPSIGRALSQEIGPERYAQWGKERFVALTIVELLEESRYADLQARRERETKRPKEPQLRVETHDGRFWFGLLGAMRSDFAPSEIGYGGALSLTHHWTDHWTWQLGAQLTFEETPVPRGRATYRLASGTAAFLYALELRRSRLFTGPGLRYGLVTAQGEANDPQATVAETVTLPWGGPLWTLQWQWAPTPGLAAHIGLESGWLLQRARLQVDEQGVRGLEGVWLTLTAGLQIAVF